jgi:hypothetical protein
MSESEFYYGIATMIDALHAPALANKLEDYSILVSCADESYSSSPPAAWNLSAFVHRVWPLFMTIRTYAS